MFWPQSCIHFIPFHTEQWNFIHNQKQKPGRCLQRVYWEVRSERGLPKFMLNVWQETWFSIWSCLNYLSATMTVWKRMRLRVLMQNQHTRELISAWKMSHKHICDNSAGKWVNIRYINSTSSTSQVYFWWSLCALHLLARQVRATVGDSGLCCVCVTSFECLLNPLCVVCNYPMPNASRYSLVSPETWRSVQWQMLHTAQYKHMMMMAIAFTYCFSHALEQTHCACMQLS